MKAFVFVLVLSSIAGGFIGGELSDKLFSSIGALLGCVGAAGLLLGIGAFFDRQERKRGRTTAPPEVQAVFERMLAKRADPPARQDQPRSEEKPIESGQGARFLETVATLMSLQLLPKFTAPKEAFGALMTNRRAAGYVFGFHDALLQGLGLYDPTHTERAKELMESSYKRMFGERAGYMLYARSISSQEDPIFHEGRMIGGTEVADFLEKSVPPLGLGRILILDMRN